MENLQFLHQNIVQANHFGNGVQGIVYEVQTSEKELILKVYKPNTERSFNIEVQILNALKGYDGFPQIHSSIKGTDRHEIMMQKYGTNVAESHIKVETVYKMCSQLVS